MELTDTLLEDFQVEAEDGSPRQVANSLIALYQACCRNDAGPLQQLRQQQAAAGNNTAASRAAAVSHRTLASGWTLQRNTVLGLILHRPNYRLLVCTVRAATVSMPMQGLVTMGPAAAHSPQNSTMHCSACLSSWPRSSNMHSHAAQGVLCLYISCDPL
jgi:hypothetical protein